MHIHPDLPACGKLSGIAKKGRLPISPVGSRWIKADGEIGGGPIFNQLESGAR